MVNCLVETIAFDALGLLDMAYACYVPPFLVVLILWNTWIHICATHHGYKTPYIEMVIDDSFHLGAILEISYVDPNYGHI